LFAGLGLLAFAGTVSAQNIFNLSFPIEELGGCGSVEECRTYCDVPANARACRDFAVANGFAQKKVEQRNETKDEASSSQDDNRNNDVGDDREHGIDEVRASEAIAKDGSGPGGCTTLSECGKYCQERQNWGECGEFAKKHGLDRRDSRGPSDRGLERMDDRARANIERKGPGGCDTKDSCDTFCRTPGNSRVCVEHAVKSGMIPAEKAEMILQAMMRMEKREVNRRLQGSGVENKNSGVDEPKIDEEKAHALIEAKGGPGGCGTFEECENYCNDESNMEACMQYAVEHKLMDGKDLERMKTMMEKGGPGGCRGRECEAYCDKEENRETCFQFAKEHGMMSEEELGDMEMMRGLDADMRKKEIEMRREEEMRMKERDDMMRKEDAMRMQEGFMNMGEDRRNFGEGEMRMGDGDGIIKREDPMRMQKEMMMRNENGLPFGDGGRPHMAEEMKERMQAERKRMEEGMMKGDRGEMPRDIGGAMQKMLPQQGEFQQFDGQSQVPTAIKEVMMSPIIQDIEVGGQQE